MGISHLGSFRRRKTREVMVGNVGVGGDNPIRIQSMTISDTMNTAATVAEVSELAAVGCEIVRITAPSIKEAENLGNIKNELRRRGVTVPLVADIHFTPNAALIAAEHVEKVRINPGNYADKKSFEQRDYTDEEYRQELLRIDEKFKPLVLKCKQLQRAMRIGVNHGSLSDRIMNRFGDTAEGMVESAVEFIEICRKYDFHEIILSMKSSNPIVAIQAYRLLAVRMQALGMDYPFHLGVTEAGDGAEGRVKSAVGIGGLLEDGIGDTIRVSLTEDAVAEIPVAARLAASYNTRASSEKNGISVKATSYQRRVTRPCETPFYVLGGEQIPRVELSLSTPPAATEAAGAEIATMLGQADDSGPLSMVEQPPGEVLQAETVHIPANSEVEFNQVERLRAAWSRKGYNMPLAVHLPHASGLIDIACKTANRLVLEIEKVPEPAQIERAINAAISTGTLLEWKFKPAATSAEKSTDFTALLQNSIRIIVQVCEKGGLGQMLFSLSADAFPVTIVPAYRCLANCLDEAAANFPIVLRYCFSPDFEASALNAAAQLGVLLCDGIGDSVHIVADPPHAPVLTLAYDILQATRVRIFKTDYISCPSCGRTLFDLQTTTERIKSKTSHLKGVKIAIMGCIVNGPGEMADADFGYVGAGPGVVNLFVGKECVERNIADTEADARLIRLIKENGRWVAPG